LGGGHNSDALASVAQPVNVGRAATAVAVAGVAWAEPVVAVARVVEVVEPDVEDVELDGDVEDVEVGAGPPRERQFPSRETEPLTVENSCLDGAYISTVRVTVPVVVPGTGPPTPLETSPWSSERLDIVTGPVNAPDCVADSITSS
jgi:hypothetical protein